MRVHILMLGTQHSGVQRTYQLNPSVLESGGYMADSSADSSPSPRGLLSGRVMFMIGLFIGSLGVICIVCVYESLKGTCDPEVLCATKLSRTHRLDILERENFTCFTEFKQSITELLRIVPEVNEYLLTYPEVEVQRHHLELLWILCNYSSEVQTGVESIRTILESLVPKPRRRPSPQT